MQNCFVMFECITFSFLLLLLIFFSFHMSLVLNIVVRILISLSVYTVSLIPPFLCANVFCGSRYKFFMNNICFSGIKVSRQLSIYFSYSKVQVCVISLLAIYISFWPSSILQYMINKLGIFCDCNFWNICHP